MSSVGGKSSLQTVLLRSFVFEAQDCTFLPKNSLYSAASVVVLCFVTVLGQLRLHITPISAVGETGQTLECLLGEINVRMLKLSRDKSLRMSTWIRPLSIYPVSRRDIQRF